jgi:hypothetical protein
MPAACSPLTVDSDEASENDGAASDNHFYHFNK